jgi:hypothetical protein
MSLSTNGASKNLTKVKAFLKTTYAKGNPNDSKNNPEHGLTVVTLDKHFARIPQILCRLCEG